MKTRESALLSLKLVVLTVALVVILGIASQVLPAEVSAAGGGQGTAAAEQAAGLLPVLLVVCFLQTVALSYPVLRSRWGGWRLVLTVFVVFYGTQTVTGQIESVVYLGDRLSPEMLRGMFLMGAVAAALFAPLLVLVLGRWKAPPSAGAASRRLAMPVSQWSWKLILLAVVFVAFYYGFGYFVAWQEPAVREYYGGTDPGSFAAQMAGIWQTTPWMFLLQAGRGLLWVVLALPVIRMMRGAWWEAGLAVSLLFTVPVLYLLLPNPLMPDAVRLTHLVETLPYQFLFAWLVVALLHRSRGGVVAAGDGAAPA